jgi:PAS domain S-box-containing protein
VPREFAPPTHGAEPATPRAPVTTPSLEEARALSELTHDAVIVWRLEGGIERWNDAATTLYGFTADQARGRSPAELLRTREGTTAHAELVAALRAAGRWQGTLERSSKGGAALTVAARMQLLRGNDGAERVLEVDRDDTARLRAEATLAQTERRLRSFVEHTPAPVAVLDRDMRYVAVSRRWISDYRLQNESLVGRSHYEVFPEVPRRWREIHRRCLAGAVERAEEDAFVRADGATDWLRWEVHPWYEADGEIGGIIVFSELITERKEAALERERLLVEVRRRAAELEATIEAVADGLVVFGADGKIAAASAQAHEILGTSNGYFGLTAEERLAQTQPRGPKGQWVAFDASPGGRALRGETVRDEIAQVTRLDGKLLWLSTSAAPIVIDGEISGAVVTFADVTERLEFDRALRESEEHFRALAEAMPQLVWVAAADGNATFLNRQWVEFTGRATATAEERRELIHPEDRARVTATWSEAIRARRDFECEYRFRRFDGTYRWLLTRAHPWRDERGEVLQWFGTATDVQDLKALSEALREADVRKDEFLAVLSHELRTPLTPIRNSVAVLDRAEPGSEVARAALRVIDRQSEHLRRLIDDLLDVTRITRGKVALRREPVQLGELVGHVVEDYASIFAASDVSLDCDLGGASLWVDGDPTRLAQIVGNLLRNSAKFTSRGGHTRVEVAAAADPDQVVLRVRDDGAGITEDLLPRLFVPFMQADRTLDRSRGGLGLGLALVKGLVELHGGDVSATSDGPGAGTLLTVVLPRIAPPTPAAGAAPEAPRRHARVLVIEDNEDAAESLQEALRFSGHHVEVALDGLAGVRKAIELVPDVVLCDLGLPGIDGYEVARRLKAEPTLARCLLVALSGYARPDDVRRSLDAGFAKHVAKPPDLDALEALVGSVEPRG